MNIRSALFPSLIPFLIAGCVTNDLTSVNLTDSSLQLVDAQSNAVEAITVGQKYSVKANFFDAEGEIISHPDYRDLEFTSFDFEVSRSWLQKVKATALPFTFSHISDPHYSISFIVKGNTYPLQTYRYSVNWPDKYELDYSGSSGRDGSDGEGGEDGGDASENMFAGDGEDGADGENGEDGTDGKDIVIAVAKYDVSSAELGFDTMLLVYDITSNSYTLVQPAPFYLNTSGGAGGDGGDGGRGGDGGDGDRSDVAQYRKDGRDGYDGDDGDGGDGGDGGDIRIYYTDPQLKSLFFTESDGGAAGDNGWPKYPGKPGNVEYIGVPKSELLKMLEAINHPDYRAEHVVF